MKNAHWHILCYNGFSERRESSRDRDPLIQHFKEEDFVKKVKKLFVLLTTLSLAVTLLAGCGGDTQETAEESQAPDAAGESADGVDWPTKPIQMIIPFDAGGDTDFHGRQYAKFLEEELGQPVAVTNVVGNGGMLAAKEVYDADPDGYTILFTHSSINVNTAAGTSDIGIDDFDMVRVCGQPAVEAIAVRRDSPYETLDDLVAAIQANPGEFIVPASIGATSHYACLLMEKACGVELNIVNSGASSDRTAGLKGGNFEFIINPYGTMKSFIDSGDFRILATLGEERSQQFPDVPTAKELGYEDLVSVNAYYILVPKGTPEEIIDKLGAAIDDISMNNEEYAQAIADAHFQDTFLLNREDSIAFAQDELARFMEMSSELRGE